MGQAWSPRIEVARHGTEQEPVIVIDDYAKDPDALIEEAAQLPFTRNANYFPGVRAATPPNLMGSIRDSLAGLIRETFGLADELNRIESYFSLITTPADQLEIIQRLPHFDGVGPARIAILHHLSRAELGGTAFYRHRSTGFETITAERLPTYNQRVNEELHRFGLPEPGLIGGDTPIYERIAGYEARFNRCLVYRGNTLHSAETPPGTPLTADPRTGRFSINTFIWLQP
jgi:hypothetical protein